MAEKLRFGIIGAGGRGIQAFARNIEKRDDAEVAALMDTNMERMKRYSKNIESNPVCYTDIDKMFEEANLDAVVITTPDYLHAEHSVKAIKHGAHVLVDKPLATTVEDCREIIDAAENFDKVAMIGFNLRHDPVLVKLKQIIEAGTLGKIFLIENREFYDGGRTYMARWNRFYDKSGGLWIHKGSHDFDVFNWLLDFPTPTKVSAFAGIDVLKPEGIPFELEDGIEPGPTCRNCHYSKKCADYSDWSETANDPWGEEAAMEDGYHKDTCMYMSEKDTHDNGIAIVEYEDGVKASHLECFVTSLTDRLYTVVGDKGQAEVSLHNRTITIRPRWTQDVIKHEIAEVKGGHGGADPKLVETFVKCVKGEIDNTSTSEHGLVSTAIGQAAEISRRENRMVDMKELLG
ncbi:MAG: Gfo/Idh/MocA family oxidoreductase [Lentisphaerae bacterium]|nr:Gfo/Idh/MocA family oxidoreductase [Lentisphaerota bacterium]MCP4101455.1 Gfo/Idh/MocA family oxidoreductase [Lentisphaerota bacterium]